MTDDPENAPMGLVDTRQFAFWMTVDHEGAADIHSNGVGKRQVAEWLQALADNYKRAADEEVARG